MTMNGIVRVVGLVWISDTCIVVVKIPEKYVFDLHLSSAVEH